MREAVEQAIARALHSNHPRERSTCLTCKAEATIALDAALAAGCLLPEQMEQVGWRDPQTGSMYRVDTNWRGFAYGKRPDWFVPVFILKGANE